MKFSSFVESLDNGEVNDSLTEQLRELTQAVNETGQPGSLTIKITLDREGNACVAKVAPTLKKPIVPLHDTLFYFGLADPSELTRRDERQQTLRGLEPQKMRDDNG